MKINFKKKYFLCLTVIAFTILGIYTFHYKTTQSIVMPPNVSQLCMKDNNNGWALTEDGNMILTADSWKSYSKIAEFNWDNQGSSIPSITSTRDTLLVFGFLPENKSIGVYYSKDGGNTWGEGYVDYSDVDRGAYQVFSSFIDNQIGYLLYCGGPAAGLMTKVLYETTDGGKTFQKINDLSNSISGYPTGLSFTANGKGFITSSYHGNNDSYLYCTDDRGYSWNTVTLQRPEKFTNSDSYGYINGYPPNFVGKNGILVLEYVYGQGENTFITYITSDEGNTWKPNGSLNIQSFSSYEFTDMDTVFAIDNTGKIFKKTRKGETWN